MRTWVVGVKQNLRVPRVAFRTTGVFRLAGSGLVRSHCNFQKIYSALCKGIGKCTFSLIGDFLRHNACYLQTKHINMILNHWGLICCSNMSHDSHTIKMAITVTWFSESFRYSTILGVKGVEHQIIIFDKEIGSTPNLPFFNIIHELPLPYIWCGTVLTSTEI